MSSKIDLIKSMIVPLLFLKSSMREGKAQVKIETFGISHKCFREVSSDVYEISQLKHL